MTSIAASVCDLPEPEDAAEPLAPVTAPALAAAAYPVPLLELAAAPSLDPTAPPTPTRQTGGSDGQPHASR